MSRDDKRDRVYGCYIRGYKGDGKIKACKMKEKQIKYFYNMKNGLYLPIVLRVSL